MLNIVVSILTTFGVLLLKGDLERIVVVTATPGATIVAQASTAVPIPQITEPFASPTAPGPDTYIIQSGDTLSGIAVAFGVPLDELLLVNNLSEFSIINPGQVLVIPAPPTVAPTSPTTVPPAAPTVAPTVVTTAPPAPPSPTITPSGPPTATPFPTPTPTPPGPVQVRIQELLEPGDVEGEGVVLINRDRTVNLERWTLGAAGGDLVFVFPRLTLARNVPVTIFTAVGTDSPQALHWGLDSPLWGRKDTVIELHDAEGDLIAAYTVP